jgi:putative transposase
MREYIRMYAPGGTFFFTLVTYHRRPILTAASNLDHLRAAFADTKKRHPFTIHAAVILPDHLHILIELPAGDADFSTRIGLVKARFSRLAAPAGSEAARPSPSRVRRRERTVWQRRFWEHTIRDDADFEAHLDYIHYNPVKHGWASCSHAWPHSSLHRWVHAGRYPADWACSCRRPVPAPRSVLGLAGSAGE